MTLDTPPPGAPPRIHAAIAAVRDSWTARTLLFQAHAEHRHDEAALRIASGKAFDRAMALVTTLVEEHERTLQWVADLQSGMYINCVYCGHRYGPDSEVPASMADVLKAHIEECPKHPLGVMRRGIRELLDRCHYPYANAMNELISSTPARSARDQEVTRYLESFTDLCEALSRLVDACQ